MKLTTAILAALSLGYALADCPNACSGNGECVTNHDYCQCYDGFMGADCSQRVCALGLAYIDTPIGDLDGDMQVGNLGGAIAPQGFRDGLWEQFPSDLYSDVEAQEGHFYMECSNRGHCDRSSGLCQCFTGFEGAACNRTSCANGCSGHGTCEVLDKFATGYVHYELWDSKKTRMCQCDGGWGGIDCSMRLCKRNDDPLTVTTTREDYNKGLAEEGEVQLVDFRCPYNGKILNPKMRLVYTDVNTGDKYSTSIFNPVDDDVSLIEDALRALPNNVLASYGNHVPLTSVAREEITADKFYRLTVTFDKALGNVADLEVEPLYECQGGLEVDALAGDLKLADNVQASYIGDGPSEDLIYEVEFTAADVYTLVVKNGAGVALGAPLTGQSYNTGVANVFDPNGNFHPETPKVEFTFGEAAPATHYDTGNSIGRKFILHVHTVPDVQVRPHTYNNGAPDGNNVLTVTGNAATVTVNHAVAVSYNAVLSIKPMSDLYSGGDGWAIYVNDEFLVYAEDFAAGAPASLTTLGNDGGWTSELDTGFLFAQSVSNMYSQHQETYTFHPNKAPIVDYVSKGVNNADDPLVVTFKDGRMPVTQNLYIVIQIVSVSGTPDTYRWKIAGDVEWQAAANIPGTPFELSGVTAYVAGLPDAMDPRREIANVVVDWSAGVDNDKRKCAQGTNKEGGKYYIRIGSDGLNDAPVCSDRGMCDYGTGECKCFKGYAGIDCSEQHALAGGSSGSAGVSAGGL